MAAEPTVLVIVLAGGEGKRLQPLTNDRAKPAVPFAGTYRMIDFALSNFANAGYRKVVVLTQYKPDIVIASLILTFISTISLEQVLTLFNQRKIVYILSNKFEQPFVACS